MSGKTSGAGDLVILADRRIVADHRREKRDMARRMRDAAECSRENHPPLPIGEPPQMFVDMLFDFMKSAVESGLWTPDRGELSIDDFCHQTSRQVSWQWPISL